MICVICQQEHHDEGDPEVCEQCWYGMRLDRSGFLVRMQQLGVLLAKGIGCQHRADGVIVCGDPYRRALPDEQPMHLQAEIDYWTELEATWNRDEEGNPPDTLTLTLPFAEVERG